MNSDILRTATRLFMPLLLLFAVLLLGRGHNYPGGGFVAGLVVSIAFVLLMMADGVEAARRALIVEPSRLLGLGMLVMLGSALFPALYGRPFLTALWADIGPGGQIAVGSPFVFDLGVCMIVIGVVLTMTFHLAED
jgi:multicomponent Na+:H+ antiporter subunit B